MTFTRMLALEVSNFVVRHASPGSKEWAEGLAREIAYIENDWRALAWALGSMRVLLDYRETPVESLADVPATARKYFELRKGVGAWALILQAPIYAFKFFDATSVPERAGCAVVVLSSIAAAIFILMENRRLKHQPSDDIYDDNVACAQLYRAELKRHCSTMLILYSFLFIWIVGAMLTMRGGVRAHAVFSAGILLLFLAATPLCLVMLRVTRRRIERLDALLAERF